VRRGGELPIEQAATWVCGPPKIPLYLSLWRIGLQKRLLEGFIESCLLGKVIFSIRVNSLKNRELSSIVVPERPTHQMSHPLLVDWTKLALHPAHHIAMTSLGQVDAIA
jgi:hypothetical protein